MCNKLTTSTKEGRETWAGKIAQTESMNTFTDQTWSRHVLLAEDTQSSLTQGENQPHACYYGGTPMRHCKTACFEALVLEPHFAQSCGRFLLLYCVLGWRTSLQRLKVAAHVLVKSWFAAPLPCTFLQCFVRKVKNAHRKHFVLAPNPTVLLGCCLLSCSDIAHVALGRVLVG